MFRKFLITTCLIAVLAAISEFGLGYSWVHPFLIGSSTTAMLTMLGFVIAAGERREL